MGGMISGSPSGAESDLPVAVVDQGVVLSAQHAAVVQVGGSAVAPVCDVVELGPFAGQVAAGEYTADVAEQQRFAAGGGEGSHGSADVQNFGGSGEDGGDDGGVAGQ